MDYRGPDRRIHKVYVTKNTEYHVRKNVCVAVRDRTSKRWAEGHMALRLRVEGGVRVHSNGALIPIFTPPDAGDALFFSYKTAEGEERQLVTSRIEEVGRPPKSDVNAYPSLFKKKAQSRD